MKTILILGDAFILLTFSLVGLRSHEQGITLMGILRNSGPLLLTWYALAPATRIYEEDRKPSLLLPHWFVAITAGVWFRQMLVGHPFSPVFWLITMGFTGALLLIFRAGTARYRRSRRQRV
jgi:hypothetical protein